MTKELTTLKARLMAKRTLSNLKQNFREEDWPHADLECSDMASFDFENDAEEETFRAELLENAQPVQRADGRPFGNLCWKHFDTEKPDWLTLKEGEDSCWWAGGGFYSLPTVEAFEGASVLFVAESQLKRLRDHPWIAAVYNTYHNQWDYVGIKNIDAMIIIPDSEIHQSQDDTSC